MLEYVRLIRADMHATNQPLLADYLCRKLALES